MAEKKLVQTRKSIKSSVTRINTFLDQFRSDNIEQIEVRKGVLHELWEKYNATQQELEDINGEQYEGDRETFETTYYDTMSKITTLMNKRQELNTTRVKTEQAMAKIKLPQISIPTFSGNYAEWNGFYDIFKSVINENDSIATIQKFFYLKSALKGEALKTVEAFATTEDNYEVALQVLVDRYNNKNYLMNAHFQALFGIPSVGRKQTSDLRNLTVESKQHLKSLETLGLPVSQWDAIVIYMLVQKLDADTRKEWELSKDDDSLPTLQQLYQFLEKRCFSSEAANPQSSASGTKWTSEKKDKNYSRLTHVTSEGDHARGECKMCKGHHELYHCDVFKRQEVGERSKMIKSFKVCFNCLKTGHFASSCNSGGCKKCRRHHHTLLHYEPMTPTTISRATDDQNPTTTTSDQTSLHNMAAETSQVLLSTAVIKMKDRNGRYQPCRVLIDSASQSNFIRASFLKRLGCTTIRKTVPIKGISNAKVDVTEAAVLEIASRLDKYIRKLEFLVIDNITRHLPVERVKYTTFELPDVQLADPTFGEPAEIDALLGGEIFLELMTEGRMRLGEGLLTLQNTRFGWIIAGRVKTGPVTRQLTTCCLSTAEVSNQIARFWELEECSGTQRILTKDERDCEEYFLSTTQRDKTGRYIVRLPFRENKNQIGGSYEIALKRFHSLERRLNRDESLKEKYTDFMSEYQSLKYMEKDQLSRDGCFLPHQAVVKESSLTTRLRVVFDASARTNTGISLNDTLITGPTLQDDMFAIIVRFRLHNIVFSADIEKMYRQVWIHKDDCKYQKILWRVNHNEEIQVYKLKTITYGTSSAPYLATRCLKQLAIDDGSSFPAAAAAVTNDFYMDDLLSGSSSVSEAEALRDGIIKLLTGGGLKLRKWSSNNAEFMKTMPNNNSEDPLMLLDMSKTTKTLGIMWNPKEDTIEYAAKNVDTLAQTKRQILSQIAQLFDPLGLMGPVIVKAKLFMQRLWMIKADWDQRLDEEVIDMWTSYRQELALIQNITIPRQVVQSLCEQIQLHGFSDASEQAYGACIYLRSTSRQGRSSMSLVCSKSRVAPLKKISLPRLELCAAVLLSQLYQRVKAALKIKFVKIVLWSDSTITLHWINTASSNLKTFVGNRVSQIQDITSECEWRHIRSQHNPADIISRGLDPGELAISELWWSGPAWISQSEEYWPCDIMSIDREKIPKEILEEKTVTNAVYLTTNNSDMFNKYSTLVKLQRLTAYCYRFISNARQLLENRTSGPLTVSEMQHSLQFLIKTAQYEVFHKEIDFISNSMEIARKSKLVQLRPVLDNDGILRVGGRLDNAKITYDRKHQIILPDKHPLTVLLIRQYHTKLLHGGTQEILTNIRQTYWPINARNNVKKIVNKCIKCLRLRTTETLQIMGNLPSVRVQPARPFLNSGVDYGGPILIKRSRNVTSKAYIALFICMSTRAIHLELVSSLSTADFLGAFRRFISRRGHCANLYSDNGTNFRGANKELIELREFLQGQTNKDRIQTAAVAEGTQWHFISPGSPHMGGLWEAGIKRVKYHLKRVVGEAKLTYEEMNTLLVQIEAIVNSRPLVPIHDESQNMSILTPAHFLIGEPLTLPAEPNLREIPQNRLSRWQLIQQQMQHFWNRWHSEYLHTLQQRTKWYIEKDNVKEGMVVLIKENNVPPLQWRLGRIQEIHPGTDGKIRVVTMKTGDGHVLKRAINKIAILPIEVENRSSQGGRDVED